MMCGRKHTFRVSWGLGQGVRGLGVRGTRGTGPCKHWPLQPTHNRAVISDTNPDRYKRPPHQTRPRHDGDKTETTPKQHRDITKKRQRQDRDTTESTNFSILKLSPSTYGSQLHWFAQRCTIYKFKLEFEILLRNPIKMFINVHQKIKTSSPKQ